MVMMGTYEPLTEQQVEALQRELTKLIASGEALVESHLLFIRLNACATWQEKAVILEQVHDQTLTALSKMRQWWCEHGKEMAPLAPPQRGGDDYLIALEIANQQKDEQLAEAKKILGDLAENGATYTSGRYREICGCCQESHGEHYDECPVKRARLFLQGS